MTPPKVKRHLVCPSHGEYTIEVGENERCFICGILGEPICACGCRSSLADLRSDAVYRSEACAKRLQRRGRPDIDPTSHPLDDARGQVEEGRTSSEWALIAREHTMRTLLETGYFTADDLEPLGIPTAYRRSVHGLVTAYFRNEKFTEEAGRRKSERPERKGAKNTVFRATAKARRELPKLLTDLQKEIAGVGGGNESGHLSRSDSSGHSSHSGEAGLTGPGRGADGAETSKEPPGPEEAPVISTASPQSGKTRNCLPGSGTGAPSPKGSGGAVLPCSSSDAALSDQSVESPEPLSLLPEPDPESWAA